MGLVSIQDAPDGSAEQCFLLGYRAVCRGVHLTERQRETIQLPNSIAQGPQRPQVRDYQRDREHKARALRKEKQAFDAALQKGNFSEVHFAAIEFQGTPEILCSDIFLPVCDLGGARRADKGSAEEKIH